MSNFVAIHNRAMPVVEYQGKRVVTFAMIDKAHDRPKGTTRVAFNRHREHFVYEEDYLSIPVSLKYQLDTLGISVPNRGLTVLTESGYLLIVKSFRDELSWKIQKELVNVYFRRNTLGELRHVDIPSLEELSQMKPEEAQHLVVKAEKDSYLGHGKPGSAAMTLRRRELKRLRPAIKTVIELSQLSICDLGDFTKGVHHG
ncbi:ORF6N domain-containing protein [Arsenophonus nasoniae]|uniref:ORF6N domain protein n=1 Tax=Arsenophonus nasoniae TaxID=638 RepID=A0A4P7L1G9_9GAMM|nr:ORF6N domain-containing protein [Arsenophonus nasoniae]QBY42622.1 ORF6N domain protein [Arsenophonus nasoniae]QBY43493.1 ORF6N domain protein [Arsenophonus nasoniae]QBY43710.1 ORF6N domain protein [Arsenophonus nasoniae]QBY44752.1 ORF6N domain protein [Arsenophonus nasoniae]WGM05043.1 ORF6N domain-containing protein [Arsenophonus nasoniae]